MSARSRQNNHKKETEVIDMDDIRTADLVKEVRTTRLQRVVGFCIDTSAPRSVIGKKELNRILLKHGIHHRRILKSTKSFRFADTTFKSLCSAHIPLNTPPGAPTIEGNLDIVETDIPALLGMDIMDKEGLTPCLISNRLAKRGRLKTVQGREVFVDDCYCPIIRSRTNHLYTELRLPLTTVFTRAQFTKMHRNFFHPSASKLFNLIKTARPENATKHTLELFKDITNRFDPCQRIKPGPYSFRVTMGIGHLRFNERVLIDIMYLGNMPVLHVVDESTHFNAACFLSSVSAADVWSAFIRC